MSTTQQVNYPDDHDGGDRSNASPIGFGMNYGAADPSAAYDDPALWCHPSATPEAAVVPSQLSTLASVQAHHIPPQHGHSYNYAAHGVYQNIRSDHHQQPGSVYLTTSCSIPNTYHTQQDTQLNGNPHIRTNAAVSALSETLLAPEQDLASLNVASLSKAASQHYASPQLRYTGVAASVQHFPELHTRSPTMPYPSFPSPADPTSVYHDPTVPPHFDEQNSATAVQFLERGHSFPGPRCVNGPASQHLGVHPPIENFQPAKPPYCPPSHHPHSPYASSPSISPSSSFISSPEASPVLPASTHPEAAPSRSASSRSSSATSSPFSTVPHLQAAATPSPPCSTASLSLPPSDTPRFACLLCRGERTFSRTKDLERHIQSIHNRDPDAPRWICCGVPLSEADRWALPEWVRREPPYMLNGVPMVGGCKEQCSRKDVLKRHLRKNESRCFGSENALWLPGNQVCKRPPRGGGSGSGVGTGHGDTAGERS